MPTYEYRCDKCGHEFEREQRITEDPIKKCPKCGALKAKRMISATTFVLKGGGWYSDLYSSSGGKKDKKGEGSSAGSGSDSGSSGAASSSGASGSSSETTSSAASKPAKGSKSSKSSAA